MNTLYIDRLKEEMIKKEYSMSYIECCCKYAEDLLKVNLPVIFDAKHVIEIFKLEKIDLKAYHVFPLKGTRHKKRGICAPSQQLKSRQRWILENILEKQSIASCVHGFVKGRSIVTNARNHLNKDNILCIDIKDFFPSITTTQVLQQFEKMGYSKSASYQLAEICTYQNILPQGAPTSPYLANLILKPLDIEIMKLADKNDIVYTRYADDITLSSNNDIMNYCLKVEEIINNYGFCVNSEKTHFMTGNHRKIVTGIVLSDKLKVPKEFKRKLKQEIYYCHKFGVTQHLEASNASKSVNYREYLYGKAYYIKMVEPSVGEVYLRQLDEIFSVSN